jgi:hypothetical protein
MVSQWVASQYWLGWGWRPFRRGVVICPLSVQTDFLRRRLAGHQRQSLPDLFVGLIFSRQIENVVNDAERAVRKAFLRRPAPAVPHPVVDNTLHGDGTDVPSALKR